MIVTGFEGPDGEYPTVQLAIDPEPLRVQVDGLKTPLLLLLQDTVPLGVVGVPGDVSDTVAVHLEPSPLPEQLTLVEVDRFAATPEITTT